MVRERCSDSKQYHGQKGDECGDGTEDELAWPLGVTFVQVLSRFSRERHLHGSGRCGLKFVELVEFVAT